MVDINEKNIGAEVTIIINLPHKLIFEPILVEPKSTHKFSVNSVTYDITIIFITILNTLTLITNDLALYRCTQLTCSEK